MPHLTPASLPASRRLVWFLLWPSAELDSQQQYFRAQLRQLSQIQPACALAHQFLTPMRQ